MLAPYLTGLGLLVIAPLLLSLLLAFTSYDTFSPPQWVGLQQFRTLMADRLARIALANTAFYVVAVALLRLFGALALALLLQQRSRSSALVRPFIYLPSIIPEIAYVLIWLVAFNPRYGPINLALSAAQLPQPDWLIAPWPTRWALVIMAVWQLGEGFILLLVSLKDVPRAVYESAEIDGAGPVARLRYITLPLLLPRLLLLSLRDIAVALQASFIPSLVMTRGGPGYATLFVPLYSYFVAFEDFRFGYAAALMWITILATVALLFIVSLFVRRHMHHASFEL